jgi:hypothetical protein
MLKLIVVGAVSLVASATHPINEDIVKEIKEKATSWVPHEVSENPLANYSYASLQGFLGTIIQGPQGLP